MISNFLNEPAHLSATPATGAQTTALPASTKTCGNYGVNAFYQPALNDKGEVTLGSPSSAKAHPLSAELRDVGASASESLCTGDPIATSGDASVYLFKFSGWGTPASDAAEENRRKSITDTETQTLKGYLQNGCRVYVIDGPSA